MLGVLEYRMVISERRGLVRRRQCRQRAQGDHSDLENYPVNRTYTINLMIIILIIINDCINLHYRTRFLFDFFYTYIFVVFYADYESAKFSPCPHLV